MPLFRFAAMAIVICLGVAAASETDERQLRIPLMPDWKLLHRVDPRYNSAALQAHIQGTVRFNATIGKDGHIERLRLVSGHPLLVPGAREAVQQWIYRPTLLSDQPVRVITQIEVQFHLDPSGKPLRKDNPNRTEQAIL